MQIVTNEQAKELINDEWARARLYSIDYTHLDKTRLALYPVNDLSQREIQRSFDEDLAWLFDGKL